MSPEEIRSLAIDALAEVYDVDKALLRDEMPLDALGDSLKHVELVGALAMKLNITIQLDEEFGWQWVGDVVVAAQGLVADRDHKLSNMPSPGGRP